MKTVFVNGTFDILHPGHIELFRVARSLGDRVIVDTDSDVKIKKDKDQLNLLMICVSSINAQVN